MNRLEDISDREYIFGIILVAANKMDTLLDRTLKKYNLTSKQWFLLLTVMSLFDTPPTLNEVARQMGSSHQNVKQLALKLQEKDMIYLEKDSQDLRVTRIVTGKKSDDFWRDIAPEGMAFMNDFFAQIDDEAMGRARRFLTQIMDNLNKMEDVSAE